MKIKIIILFILLLLLGCASAQFKQIKDYNLPIKGKSFSVLPPQDDGWTYSKYNQPGVDLLSFAKKLSSPTHTLAAIVVEKYAFTSYDNPEQFLYWVKKDIKKNIDTNRFKVIEIQTSLDDTFGKYCVSYYSFSQDHNAVNKGANDYLVMKIHGIVTVHPEFDSTLIDISYSERGQSYEMSPNFKHNALNFIQGIKFDKKSY